MLIQEAHFFALTKAQGRGVKVTIGKDLLKLLIV